MTTKAIKGKYPRGTRIILTEMHDEPDMPRGLCGTVQFVDDIGQIHMHWDNGRTLALIPEVDVFSIILQASNT